MSSMADIYTSQVHNQFRSLYGNWPPNTPIKLGDYGLLNNQQFNQLGNIGDPSIGITFSVRNQPSKDQYIFSSTGTTTLKFTAAGTTTASGVNVKASLEVDFSSEESVFFNAAEVTYDMIEDKVTLGNSIKTLYDKGTWNSDWVVVTDLLTAGSTTIAISGGQASSITFQATGDVPQIDLANASIGLMIASSSNVTSHIVAEQGLSPLIGLCSLQNQFLWWDKQFGPALLFKNLNSRNQLQLAKQFSNKAAPNKTNPIFFGQMS